MSVEKWLELFEEASKVLHMDKSHDAIRSGIQAAISTQHRMDNAGSDSSSYYDTPYVRDVYGDENGGTVVHSHKGKLTASKYAKSKDGYALSSHKPVKQAYVSDNDADDKKESFGVMIGGQEIMVSESLAAKEMTEVIELQEASVKGTKATVTLIRAGKGSMGYYSEAALEKAAKDGIFGVGTQMFLNHQTKEERAARPEGDVTKLAAKTTTAAKYVKESGKPGRLVSDIDIYPDVAPFVQARKADLGVSVRVGAAPSGKVQEGVPLVENMVYALSADFVTRAGAGGKIEELYESYREANPVQRQQAVRSEEAMTEQELNQFKLLQEAHAANALRLDRMAELNTNLQASVLISEALGTSGLSPRGQTRVKNAIMVTLPLTADKVLDVAKLQESIKAAITDEVAYLQECGVRGPQIVRNQGSSNVEKFTGADGKELTEAEVVAQTEKLFTESVGSIMGKEKSA